MNVAENLLSRFVQLDRFVIVELIFVMEHAEHVVIRESQRESVIRNVSS